MHQVGNYKVLCFDRICYVKIYFSAILKVDRHKCLFNKEVKFISFEASKKHVQVHRVIMIKITEIFL